MHSAPNASPADRPQTNTACVRTPHPQPKSHLHTHPPARSAEQTRPVAEPPSAQSQRACRRPPHCIRHPINYQAQLSSATLSHLASPVMLAERFRCQRGTRLPLTPSAAVGHPCLVDNTVGNLSIGHAPLGDWCIHTQHPRGVGCDPNREGKCPLDNAHGTDTKPPYPTVHNGEPIPIRIAPATRLPALEDDRHRSRYVDNLCAS